MTIELQNQKYLAIQLSIPFKFGHQTVWVDGFADVDVTWWWQPFVSVTPPLSYLSLSLPSDGRWWAKLIKVHRPAGRAGASDRSSGICWCRDGSQAPAGRAGTDVSWAADTGAGIEGGRRRPLCSVKADAVVLDPLPHCRPPVAPHSILSLLPSLFDTPERHGDQSGGTSTPLANGWGRER